MRRPHIHTHTCARTRTYARMHVPLIELYFFPFSHVFASTTAVANITAKNANTNDFIIFLLIRFKVLTMLIYNKKINKLLKRKYNLSNILKIKALEISLATHFFFQAISIQ